MRHLRSVLYSLVLAPAVWILCGVGFDQDLTGRARDNGGIESLSGVLLLLLAGAAYAILLFSPISPAGPLLAGLAFAGVGAWARIAPDSYAGVWPANVAEDGFDLSTPGYGLAVLLAVPLLCVALSARRWRGYEPPEILLIGTIGRARVAGTPMAAERTTFIPQQRPAPGFGPPSADATQIVPPPGRPAEDDEKTTVMRFGQPPAPGRRTEGDEPTTAMQLGRPQGDEPTTAMQLGRPPVPVPDRRTGGDEPTQLVPPAAEPETVERATVEPATEDLARSSAGPASAEEATTGNVTGDEKTQLLTLPGPDGDEQTLAVRPGTVEPPGDRTQMLTFRPPESPATAPAESREGRENTKAMSIVGSERPDPGEDPTTRLGTSGPAAGEATTRASSMTVNSLERPADEAADDTRPLTLPAPRPPAEEDTTRHL